MVAAMDLKSARGLLASLEGKPTVYRGRDGVREWFRDADGVLGESRMEFSEIRDLGDRIVAFGHYRTRGEASGGETVSQIAYVVEYRNGKATRVQSFLGDVDLRTPSKPPGCRSSRQPIAPDSSSVNSQSCRPSPSSFFRLRKPAYRAKKKARNGLFCVSGVLVLDRKF